MRAGDVLVFARHANGSYVVHGRKGTPTDSSRKPPTKRAASEGTTGKKGGGGGSRGSAGGRSGGGASRAALLEEGGPRAKKAKQAAAAQQVGGERRAVPDSQGLVSNRYNSRCCPVTEISPPPLCCQVAATYDYWAGQPVPPRRDGVFRAMAHNGSQEINKARAGVGGGDVRDRISDNQEGIKAQAGQWRLPSFLAAGTQHAPVL